MAGKVKKKEKKKNGDSCIMERAGYTFRPRATKIVDFLPYRVISPLRIAERFFYANIRYLIMLFYRPSTKWTHTHTMYIRVNATWNDAEKDIDNWERGGWAVDCRKRRWAENFVIFAANLNNSPSSKISYINNDNLHKPRLWDKVDYVFTIFSRAKKNYYSNEEDQMSVETLQ